MSIAYWVKRRIAKERQELIAEAFAIGFQESYQKSYWEAFRESYYRGYNDAVRDKAAKKHRENSGHCPRSPFYTPRTQL